MNFEDELQVVVSQIKNAQDENELNYIRRVNEKKYWWTSIFICGLFYGLNGKIGKMILGWILAIVTLGIYGIYLIYKSYKDQKEFNDAMEYAILQRIRELQGNGRSSNNSQQIGGQPVIDYQETPVLTQNTTVDNSQGIPKFCPACGTELTPGNNFCPACGEKLN